MILASGWRRARSATSKGVDSPGRLPVVFNQACCSTGTSNDTADFHDRVEPGVGCPAGHPELDPGHGLAPDAPFDLGGGLVREGRCDIAERQDRVGLRVPHPKHVVVGQPALFDRGFIGRGFEQGEYAHPSHAGAASGHDQPFRILDGRGNPIGAETVQGMYVDIQHRSVGQKLLAQGGEGHETKLE